MKSYQLIQGECESCIFASKGCGCSVGHEECLDTDQIWVVKKYKVSEVL